MSTITPINSPTPSARLSLEVAEQSPLRAVLRGTTPLGERSTLVVRYILDAGSRWLRIEAEVEWQEAHQFLRYHLPTGYRGRWARFGNPFGSIQRTQQPGVQADEAMWEVPGNRWAAVLNEDGRGMAIITEAKYGFSCKDGDLGVSLLRSTKEPDTEADMGRHTIRFAVGRHEADDKRRALCHPGGGGRALHPTAGGARRRPALLPVHAGGSRHARAELGVARGNRERLHHPPARNARQLRHRAPASSTPPRGKSPASTSWSSSPANCRASTSALSPSPISRMRLSACWCDR